MSLCQFQSAPKQSHLTTVKRIFRYLVQTKDIGLWYPRDEDFNIIGYSNADYAGTRSIEKAPMDFSNSLDIP